MSEQLKIKNNKIFAPLKNEWLVLKPEEEVRQKYILRLAENYGFAFEQMAQDFDFSKYVKDKNIVDIVVWKNVNEKKTEKKPLILIQCKSDSIIIRPEDFFKGIEIAKSIGIDFFVATNSKQTKVYSKVFKIKNNGIPDELINIPTKEQAQEKSMLQQLLNQTNEFAKTEFNKTLLKCHNIIRNNDKLSPEAAFDEISKILFIKIRYERTNSENLIFSKLAYMNDKTNYNNYKLKDSKDFYQFLFEQTKEDFKGDDLFEPNEIIRIRENSFEAIVEELQIYNLSTTSDDVKGIAFEQFLGKTFRGELGQFFTPRTIVDFMVEILDPQEGEVICDPCCGSGGFLIKAFEYVRAKIENKVHQAKKEIKNKYYDQEYYNLTESKKQKIDEKVNYLFSKLNAELDINNPKSRIRTLSYECIFGTDANPRMSRTAKMNMIMHGDGHGGVHHNDGLLNVNGIFENRFDVILTNPPFGSRVEKSLKITEADKYTDIERIKKYTEMYGKDYENALRQVNDNIGKSLLDLYETGSMSTLTEVLFIERCLRLLKPGGRMAIVLPEGVLNNNKMQKIRDYVESKAKILLITSIPQDVFIASGATVKPSLLFFKKFTESEATQYKEICENAEQTVKQKYTETISEILSKLSAKGKAAPDSEEKKKLKAVLKQLEEKMAGETKMIIKKEFDYEIPIAEVEKAGISSTGSEIENELIPLKEEFNAYRSQHNLWENKFELITNEIADEPQSFYGK